MTRDEWSANQTECWVCGWPRTFGEPVVRSLHTHEIACGAGKEKAMLSPAAWIRVCSTCHPKLHDYGQWPIKRQLNLKRTKDPKHYCRCCVNLLRGRFPDAITEEDVDDADGHG
jgi:hypothetical protein